jgi:protein subunit release factor A
VISDGVWFHIVESLVRAATLLAKQHAELADLVAAYRQWRQVRDDLEAAWEMARGPSAGTAILEIMTGERESRGAELEEQLRMLLPTGPYDEWDTILEIRAAAGERGRPVRRRAEGHIELFGVEDPHPD